MKRIEQEQSGQLPRKPSPEIEDDIRRRAYEIYATRGYTGGSEIDDWLRAESEVLEKKNLSKAA
jgi:Protein of unknown function (DUF2934)